MPLFAFITRSFDRRLGHLEQVINARSEEQIAAIERLTAEVRAIAESHHDLAENITHVIENHLTSHVESMTALGGLLAEARALIGTRDNPTEPRPGDAPPGE